MQLAAKIGGDTAPTLKRSRLELGMGRPQGTFTFWAEESDVWIVGESRVGDLVGFAAQISDQVDVEDSDASEVLFSGVAVSREKTFSNQVEPPYQVKIGVLDWAWRLANPPEYFTAAYQSATQTAKSIVTDVLERTGLDELGFTAGGVDETAIIPPILFERANAFEVLEALSELIAGSRWYVEPSKQIILKETRFFSVSDREVRETVSS